MLAFQGAIFASGAAFASAPDHAGLWEVGAPVHFSWVELRSASLATDNKPLEIHGQVVIKLAPDSVDHYLLSWKGTDVVVTPDPAPVKRNIPQLRDSVLFDPDLELRFRVDTAGMFVDIANLQEIGAAMRRGFPFKGPAESNEPFFEKITSKQAIEGAVAKIQIAILNATAVASTRAGQSETALYLLPGSTLQIGNVRNEWIETDIAKGQRHFRETRTISREMMNAATSQYYAQFGVPANSTPQVEADVVETVDLLLDADTNDLAEIHYSQATTVGGNPSTLSYNLNRL